MPLKALAVGEGERPFGRVPLHPVVPKELIGFKVSGFIVS